MNTSQHKYFINIIYEYIATKIYFFIKVHFVPIKSLPCNDDIYIYIYIKAIATYFYKPVANRIGLKELRNVLKNLFFIIKYL